MSKLSRFANLWRHRELEAEFDEELRFHFDMRVDANLRAGLSRANAEAEAHRHLGRNLHAREGMREARVMMWLDSFTRDLGYGVRLFLRQPGTTALAVLTLSLGIGANAVIFSLVYALLLRPLPFAHADRLVSISDSFRTEGQGEVGPTVPELLDLRSQSRSFDSLAFYDTRDVQITGGTEPARAFAARVEGSFLSTLAVSPALGRLFVADDNVPGHDRVVILTDGFWRRTFGADPSVIGRSILLNGVANEVVGILPAGFHFDYLSGEAIELYVPFSMSSTYTSRSADFANVRRVFALARLKDDVSLTQAAADAEAISASIARAHPELYRRGSDGRDLGFYMTVQPLRSAVAAGRSVLLLLSAAVALVLLIACLNTAQFLLARALERQHEVAVRSALGASRGRLACQFLTEALLLAVAASVAALLQATWLLNVLSGPLATHARMVGGIGVEPAVVAFTAAVALATTLTFGLLPALRFARVHPIGRFDLRGGSVVRSRSRHLMIAFQVACSVVLLISAGVLVTTLVQLQRAPSGYSAESVLVMRMRASPGAASTTGQLYKRYLERIHAVPGVADAAFTDRPLPGSAAVEFSVVGSADDAATLSQQRATWHIISPRYFSVLGIPMLAGRGFDDNDAAGRPPVAIVNEELVRRVFAGRSALGQQIRSGVGPRAVVATIVGVVGNVRPVLQDVPVPQIYVSYLQQSEPSISLLVRGESKAASAEAIKQAVWSVVPEQPLFDIRPLDDMTNQWMAQPRLITQLLGGFAGLALLMSTLGVYMIVTYLTSRRVKEIAVRRAIGASSGDVLRLLTGQTTRWTIAGVVIGIGGAVAANGTLRAVLNNITQPDLRTVAIVGAAYLAVVVTAVCIPAVRALRLDPAAVLRAE